MAKQTDIQWTEATWNPWHGCKKISTGCKYCYMFRAMNRWKGEPTTVIRSKSTFQDPLKWKEPRTILTCSWSDFFMEKADEWRTEAWDIIRKTPHHTYQILTKRPGRIAAHLPEDWGAGWDNVWLGTTVENGSAEILHKRVLDLIQIPAKKRFLSAEPLLKMIFLPLNVYLSTDFYKGIIKDAIHWVIIGGESGNEHGKYRYRPCKPEWIQLLVEQCKQSNIPVFVKQLGTHIAKQYKLKSRHGADINEWPDELNDIKVRQYPEETKCLENAN